MRSREFGSEPLAYHRHEKILTDRPTVPEALQPYRLLLCDVMLRALQDASVEGFLSQDQTYQKLDALKWLFGLDSRLIEASDVYRLEGLSEGIVKRVLVARHHTFLSAQGCTSEQLLPILSLRKPKPTQPREVPMNDQSVNYSLREIESVLQRSGFQLHGTKKHRVWKHPDGRRKVMPQRLHSSQVQVNIRDLEKMGIYMDERHLKPTKEASMPSIMELTQETVTAPHLRDQYGITMPSIHSAKHEGRINGDGYGKIVVDATLLDWLYNYAKRNRDKIVDRLPSLNRFLQEHALRLKLPEVPDLSELFEASQQRATTEQLKPTIPPVAPKPRPAEPTQLPEGMPSAEELALMFAYFQDWEPRMAELPKVLQELRDAKQRLFDMATSASVTEQIEAIKVELYDAKASLSNTLDEHSRVWADVLNKAKEHLIKVVDEVVTQRLQALPAPQQAVGDKWAVAQHLIKAIDSLNLEGNLKAELLAKVMSQALS